MLAAGHGHLKVARLLLEDGADIDSWWPSGILYPFLVAGFT